MATDPTITAVANGGSPQPVKEQPNTYASKEASEALAEEIVEGESEDDLADAEESVDGELQAAAEDAGMTPNQIQNLKKKLKLKIDGEEVEEEIDWADEEGLKRHLQKAKAFDKRAQEFAEYKNQVEQLVKMLKEDPETLLERAGLNVDELAEKRLSRKIEEMKKSPEQLEKEKMQKELEEYRKKAKAAEEEKQRAEQERMRNEQAAEIENEIMKALDGGKTKLPKNNPRVAMRIGQMMYIATQNGYPNVTPKDVLPIVEKEWFDELRSYFDESSEDFIEEIVGKHNFDRVRKKRLAKRPAAKTTTANQLVKDTGTKPKMDDEDSGKPKRTFKKYFSIHDD
jgi:DNA repair exonuclease SbcCD ATPase subunit